MDEEIILDSVTDEETILPEQNSVLSDEDIKNISQNILTELVEQSFVEDSEEQSEEESSEPDPQIDYTQQLSDINSSIADLRSDLDSLGESVALQSDTLEVVPSEIRSEFDDIITFQYLTFSLIFGVLVAIIFFQGLRK